MRFDPDDFEGFADLVARFVVARASGPAKAEAIRVAPTTMPRRRRPAQESVEDGAKLIIAPANSGQRSLHPRPGILTKCRAESFASPLCQVELSPLESGESERCRDLVNRGSLTCWASNWSNIWDAI